MFWFEVVTALLAAFLVAAGTAIPLKRLALARGWVDRPDGERKNHAGEIPRIGGLMIVLGIAAGIGTLVVLGTPIVLPGALLAGALLMVAVGVYDDAHPLGFRTKFVFQIVAAYLAVWGGVLFDLSGLPFAPADPESLLLLSFPLTMLWIVGVINAVNLLDGLDGLAGGVVAIMMTALAAIFALHGQASVTLVALCAVAAIGGFLVHNSNPASLFMGDTGSLLLGYLVATFALSAPASDAPVFVALVPVLVLGLPLVDTSVSILRRLLDGRSPFAADGDHIHHRVLRRVDHSVPRTVVLLYLVTAAYAVGAFALSFSTPLRGAVVLVIMAVLTYVLLRVLGYPRIRATMRKLLLVQRLHRMKRRRASLRRVVPQTEPGTLVSGTMHPQPALQD